MSKPIDRPGHAHPSHKFVPCPQHGGLCWAGGAIDEKSCHQVNVMGDKHICGLPEEAPIHALPESAAAPAKAAE